MERLQAWSALGCRGTARLLLQITERRPLSESARKQVAAAIRDLQDAMARDGSDLVTGKVAESRLPDGLLNGLSGLTDMIHAAAKGDFKASDEWVEKFDEALGKLAEARLMMALEPVEVES